MSYTKEADVAERKLSTKLETEYHNNSIAKLEGRGGFLGRVRP